MTSRLAAGVMALMLIGPTGCGGGGDPTEVVRDYYEALAQRDGEAACELLTPSAQTEFIAESDGDGTCAEAQTYPEGDADLERLMGIEVSEAQTRGDSAEVSVSIPDEDDVDTGVMLLARTDDGWRIEGVD